MQIHTILSAIRGTRNDSAFDLFSQVTLGYIQGNPELTLDQEQLLIFWIDKYQTGLTVKLAVDIARWINTEILLFSNHYGQVITT